MKRFDIINRIIRWNRYSRYLEIGHRDGHNFSRIKCKYKTSVDPRKSLNPKIPCQHQMTSDEFFAVNLLQFDIIFIDGLHHQDQSFRDIQNSLKILTPNGSIVVHDCCPPDEESQIVPQSQEHWNGDVWKAWVSLRKQNGLKMSVLNVDEGCGVIRRDPSSKGIEITGELTWENFVKNKKKWLNLVDYKDFFRDNRFAHR